MLRGPHVAVLTCLYPHAEQFVADFAESLCRQTLKEFDLFVVLDGSRNAWRFFEGCPFRVHYLQAEGSPARLRKTGVKWVAQHGAREIIFADIDDYFSPTRFELVAKGLQEHAVVFNELALFKEKGEVLYQMFSDRFQQGQLVDHETILHWNCLGLSNTGVHVEMAQDVIDEVPDYVVAFDWPFYTRILHRGHQACFSKDAVSYYRQYGENIASPSALKNDDILRGVKVKSLHYRSLQDLGAPYQELAASYGALWERVGSDFTFSNRFCDAVREKTPKRPLWWEAIKKMEDLAS